MFRTVLLFELTPAHSPEGSPPGFPASAVFLFPLKLGAAGKLEQEVTSWVYQAKLATRNLTQILRVFFPKPSNI